MHHNLVKEAELAKEGSAKVKGGTSTTPQDRSNYKYTGETIPLCDNLGLTPPGESLIDKDETVFGLKP